MIDTSELDSAMEWLLSNLTFLENVEKQRLPQTHIYIHFYHKLHKCIVTYTISYIYIYISIFNFTKQKTDMKCNIRYWPRNILICCNISKCMCKCWNFAIDAIRSVYSMKDFVSFTGTAVYN
jgi:hypothetical protein